MTIESNPTMGHFPLISWRAIMAGFLISTLAGATLLALGIGLGGLSVEGSVLNNQENTLALTTGIWVFFTGLVSLFLGSYYAARVSNFITSRVGAAQGLVIAALVFSVIIFQMAFGVGVAGHGVIGVLGMVSGTQMELAHDPEVQRVILQMVNAQSNLRSEPELVAQGILMHLASGDTNGAKEFLADQAGIPRGEAGEAIDAVTDRLQASFKATGVQTAREVAGFGWALFGILFFGSAFAALGGALGSKINFRRPLARSTTAQAC